MYELHEIAIYVICLASINGTCSRVLRNSWRVLCDICGIVRSAVLLYALLKRIGYKCNEYTDTILCWRTDSMIFVLRMVRRTYFRIGRYGAIVLSFRLTSGLTRIVGSNGWMDTSDKGSSSAVRIHDVSWKEGKSRGIGSRVFACWEMIVTTTGTRAIGLRAATHYWKSWMYL